MQERLETCGCNITDSMTWAGPAIQLCQHSTRAAAEEVREKLLDVTDEFAQAIDPKDMFGKTIAELSNLYRQQATGPLANLMDRDENIIVNINFMRELSINVQILMCTMITQLDQQEENRP